MWQSLDEAESWCRRIRAPAQTWLVCVRYVVGWDAQLIRYVISYLPAWVVDWAQTLQDYGERTNPA
jgi:hypothetical protein